MQATLDFKVSFFIHVKFTFSDLNPPEERPDQANEIPSWLQNVFANLILTFSVSLTDGALPSLPFSDYLTVIGFQIKKLF